MQKSEPLLVVLGTRPDAIKLAPVLRELRTRGASVFALSTGQHRELLEPLEGMLDLRIDESLDVMRPGASLAQLHAEIVRGVDRVLERIGPRFVVVQGDTSTAFSAAFAAYCRQVPIAHVEAGLRTGDCGRPWPEEGHRQAIARFAAMHFAPTEHAAKNLRDESVSGEIHVVGNTVVDSLQWIRERGRVNERKGSYVVVTCHRREEVAASFERVAHTISEVAKARSDLEFVLPVHPNPVVRAALETRLGGLENVRLIEPMNYDRFIGLLGGAVAVVTDSGGVQEEAVALGVPTLVMREASDRPEAVDAGCAQVVGFDVSAILEGLRSPPDGDGKGLFGDGHAAERISDVLLAPTER